MIVITTPAGQIGRQVLGNLLDSGEQLRVIARDPSQLPAGVREDLDIVEGSHGDAAVVDKAFADANAVLWVTPAAPRALSVDAAFAGFTRPAAEAFNRHRVGRVVGVSMLGRGTPWAARAGFVTGLLAMDDLIAASEVAYRALANPYLMEDTLRQAGSIKSQGMFSWPIAGAIASGRPSPPATSLPPPRGCCSTQARAVPARSRCSDPRICLTTTWPRSCRRCSARTCASSRSRSRPTRTGFVRLGVSDAMAQGYTDMAWAKNEGLDNGVQRTPENSTPTSFRQWCEEVLKPVVAS
jgi:hypothetical protein